MPFVIYAVYKLHFIRRSCIESQRTALNDNYDDKLSVNTAKNFSHKISINRKKTFTISPVALITAV